MGGPATPATPSPPNLNWNALNEPEENFSIYFLVDTIPPRLVDNCVTPTIRVIEPEDEKKCVARGYTVYLEKCKLTASDEDCRIAVHNGIYPFCKIRPTYGGCSEYLTFMKKPPTTTLPPTTLPPPTTTEPTTTTAAPFPIIPAVGGFVGGALLMAVILIATFFIWKKKKAKKAGMGPSGSGSKSPAASKSKTPTPGGKTPAGKSPVKNHPRNSVYLGKGPD